MSREEYEQSRAYAIDENFPKGLGDPDFHEYYPGEDKPKHTTPSVYRQKHWSKQKSYTVLPARQPRDFGDNDASDAEQAGWYGKGE